MLTHLSQSLIAGPEITSGSQDTGVPGERRRADGGVGGAREEEAEAEKQQKGSFSALSLVEGEDPTREPQAPSPPQISPSPDFPGETTPL